MTVTSKAVAGVTVWIRGPGQPTSVRNHSPLAPVFANSTNLKRIQTPHCLFCDFGGDKRHHTTIITRSLGCKVRVWVQVWAVVGHLVRTPEGCSSRRWKINSQALLATLRHSSSYPMIQLWLVRRASTNITWQGDFESAAVGSLFNERAPLLQYWLNSRFTKVLMLCKVWIVRTIVFVTLKWNFIDFVRTCYRPTPHVLLDTIFSSFIALWVTNGICRQRQLKIEFCVIYRAKLMKERLTRTALNCCSKS